MSASTRGPVRRALLRFTLGSGPLKRRSDRVQALARLLLVLTVLAAAPLAVLATGIARGHLAAAAAAQAAQRHEGRAVVARNTRAAPSDAGDGSVSIVSADVTWAGVGGAVRHGALLVPAGTVAGTAVAVWVDNGSGDLTTSPLDQGTVSSSSIAIGVVALFAVPMTVWGAYCLLCAVLDAHRGRRWAQDWARVEREWRMRLR